MPAEAGSPTPLMPPPQSAWPRSHTQLPLTVWSKNTESILSDGQESHGRAAEGRRGGVGGRGGMFLRML